MCFGASIVAILMWIRYILTFMDNRLKAITGASACARWFTCCIACCLWVLQKIIEFINRNAYIMVAVKVNAQLDPAGIGAELQMPFSELA